MNTTHTQIIECSRRNAVGVSQFGDYTNRNNAVWENRVDLDIPVGAMVNMEYGIINAKGSDADATIEISGLEDNYSKITDNQILMEFTPYICDNGYNSVKLPMVASTFFNNNNYQINAPNVASGAAENFSQNFQYLATCGLHTYRGMETYSNVSSPHSQLGFPLYTQHNINFTFHSDYGNYWGYSPKTLMTASNIPATNKKYIKINSNYQGWSKTGFHNSDADQYYFSKYTDFYAEKVEVPIQIDAPTFESPATICNKINTILHTTYPQDDHTFGEVPINLGNGRIVPSANGLMMNSYRANGYNGDSSGDNSGYRKRLWGQLAVEDLSRWKAIHTIMRCTLADDMKLYLERTTGGNTTTEFVYMNRPCIVIPKTTMKSSGNLPYYSSAISNGDFSFFPKISKQFQFKNDKNPQVTIDKTIYYTCLPKYFMFTTNIEYTDANVARLATLFKGCEEYIGDSNDPNNTDDDNWFCRCDFGVSRDSANYDNTPNNNSTNRPPIPDGGAIPPLDMNNEYNRPTWCTADLGVGFFNVCTANNNAGYNNTRSEYAFSCPMTMLDICFDFHTAMNMPQLGGNATEKYRNFNFGASTKRSDIPDKGYRGWYWDSQTGDDNWDTSLIASIDHDVPHRFKDNYTKDASVCCFSRYDEDWRTNSRTNNFKKEDAEGDYTKSGYGSYRSNSIFYTNTDGTPLDDSISQKHGIGVYPIRVEYQNVFSDFFYDLNNRVFNGVQKNGLGAYYQNTIMFYIADNSTKVRWWKQPTDTDFTEIDDFYVYDALNETIQGGNPTLAGNTYTDSNGVQQNVPKEGEIPLGTFIFDRGATKRWIGIMNPDDAVEPYSISIFPFTNNNVSNTADGMPFGILGQANTEIVKLVQVTTLLDEGGYSALTPTLKEKSNKKYATDTAIPEKKANGEYEIVCGFRLFRDSATIDANGDFQVATDFALPQLYNGQYCPISTSFLDNPAVWLVNDERVDENAVPPENYDQMINFVNMGASDPTCEFDAAQSRALFRSLHTARQLGINEMPTDGQGNYVTTTLGQIVIKFNDTKQPYANLIDIDTTQKLRVYNDRIKATGLQDATCGQFISKIYGQKKGQLITNGDDDNAVAINDEETFFNSLLYKLGFQYEDFFPTSGTQVARHNEAYENDFSKVNRYKSVKPLTTNADFNIAAQPDLATQDHTLLNSQGAGQSTYKLGYDGTNEFSLQQEKSTEIVASGLPTKLDTSFYQVYSNLVPTDYQQSQEKLQCIGIIPRNWTSGDYVYAYASSYQIPVAFPTKIHSIKTEIRLPTGELAPINEKSTIVYKISRPMVIPDAQELMGEIVKQEQKIQEEQLHKHEKDKTPK